MKKYILIILIALSPIAIFGQSFYSLTYDISYALGKTNDHISIPAFRGVTLIDSRSFVTDDISLGGSISWHTFYQTESGTFEKGSNSVSGTQYRYINSFPIMFTGHYYFGDGSTTTFYAGTGVGVVSFEKLTQMGLYIDGKTKWHFGIAPQIGVLVPVSSSVDLHLSLKYNQTFKAGDYTANQYLSLSLGFAWW